MYYMYPEIRFGDVILSYNHHAGCPGPRWPLPKTQTSSLPASADRRHRRPPARHSFHPTPGMMNSLLWTAAVSPMLLLSRPVAAFAPMGRSIAQHSSLATAAASANSAITEITENGVYVVNAEPDPLPDPLHNDYYLLRHGQSEGNVEGVISSARSLATSEKHSLTPLGYEQGRESAKQLLEKIESEGDGGTAGKKRRVFFYSSPFARARQTAKACMDALLDDEVNKKKVGELHLDIQTDAGVLLEDGIMERYFGRLDDAAIHTYAYVWPVDMFTPFNTGFDVESVAAVSTRLRETVMKIDGSERHSDAEEGDILVMASHADVLQILQVYASGAENVGLFSQFRFANGEIRKMKRTVDSLPTPQPLAPPEKGT
jgi:broad specificity phosphatase PhoE